MADTRTTIRTLLSGAVLMAGANAWAAYKCVDERGKAHYQDTPPQECANVVIYEVNTAGGVIRRIVPSGAAAAPVSREADRAAVDRARRDRTLLDTFASEQEIDAARDRNLELLKSRVAIMERNLEQTRKRRQQLDAAAQRKAPSAALDPDRERLKSEEAATEETLARYHADMDRTTAQFAQDKKRWKELKDGPARP